MQNIPDWKQYEWLLTKIFHDEYSYIDTTVLHNQNIVGKYSETNRQIDILIRNINTNVLTLVECKNRSRPIDITGIGEFLEIVDDTKVDYAIMISSSGFTASAINRVKHLGNIKLEDISWMDAYESAMLMCSEYGHMSDICQQCSESHNKGREVPGLLCWEFYHCIFNGKASMIALGKCLKCKELTVYCDVCGITNLVGKDELCCDLVDNFLQQDELIY